MLVRQLADWAVGARQVHAVIKLPLDGLEEQVYDNTHARTHTCISHTCNMLGSDTLQMQPTSYLLLFVAGCPACGLNVSMGFGVMEARLAATFRV